MAMQGTLLHKLPISWRSMQQQWLPAPQLCTASFTALSTCFITAGGAAVGGLPVDCLHAARAGAG